MNNSEYLLVIVSKKFYQKNISEDSEAKHWGLREIEHFQKINSNKNNGNKMHHIITLLALKDDTEIITENNAKEYYLDELVISNNEEKIYSLSSTLYSPNKLLNRFNYLDGDFGKVLCPLLKCKMETITAFEKKRNHKIRVRQIFSIITLIILISSIIISIITFKNAQLHEKNIEIQQKNDEIEEQNQSLLIENSYHLINEADYLYKDGNIIEAIKTLVSALPVKENPRPFVTEVISSISKYISPFEFYNIFFKEEIIHDKRVEYIPYFDENRLVTCAGDYIRIWDYKKNSFINKIHVKSDLFPSPYYLFSTNFDDNKIDNDFESLNFSDNDEDKLENHIWLSGKEKKVNLKKQT